jgi:hypothetical protein
MPCTEIPSEGVRGVWFPQFSVLQLSDVVVLGLQKPGLVGTWLGTSFQPSSARLRTESRLSSNAQALALTRDAAGLADTADGGGVRPAAAALRNSLQHQRLADFSSPPQAGRERRASTPLPSLYPGGQIPCNRPCGLLCERLRMVRVLAIRERRARKW